VYRQSLVGLERGSTEGARDEGDGAVQTDSVCPDLFCFTLVATCEPDLWYALYVGMRPTRFASTEI
jgi:hypothetical protein